MKYLLSGFMIVFFFLLFVPYWNNLRLSCAAKRFRNICYGMNALITTLRPPEGLFVIIAIKYAAAFPYPE